MCSWIAALLCLALALPCAARGEAAVDVVYYFFNPCASCDEGQVFSDAFYDRVKQAGLSGRYRLTTCNAFSEKEQYQAALAQLGLPSGAALPMLAMGARTLSGAEALESDLIPWLQGEDVAVQTAEVRAETPIGEGDLIYLYAPGCRSCAQMKAVLAALDLGELEVLEINLYDAPAQADALFEQYGVPEAERLVPMVFYGGGYVGEPERAEQLLGEWIAGQ